MKENRTSLRLAAALLLASTAFPLTPALAQDAQAETPAESAPAQDAQTPAPAEEPPVIDAPPVELPAAAAPVAQSEAQADTQEAPAARDPAAARTTTRARPAPAARPRAQAAAPVRSATRTAAPDAVPVEATVFEAPPLAAPAPVEELAPSPPIASDLPQTVIGDPPADAAAADPQPAQDAQAGDSAPLLLVLALAIAGIAALYFFRRRRRVVADNRYPAYAAEPEPVAPLPLERTAPAAAAAPVAAAVAVPAAAATTSTSGRPWIELLMRPVRAGVDREDARVEFELCVDNKGSAPAEDVRISTFLLPAGAEASEMERALIENTPEARLPEAIAAGDAKRIASAVALPRSKLHDSILPVVVADARYRLPDGSEGRTSVSYAVGVPWEGDLAHFDVNNPSGLHEGVEARLQGEPQKV